METVEAVAIGVLASIFLISLVVVLFLCRHRYCRKIDLITAQHKDSRPDVQLITESGDIETHTTSSSHPPSTDVELEHVQLTNPRMEEILKNEQWVDDATGLIPHCIAILKTCHDLTEKLVGMTMGNAQMIRTQETLTDIIAVAKRISPRVDEVVKSMYPPLDPRLLEARCTALALSVHHLVLVTKNACRLSGVLDWIDQSLADVEDHLRVLRDASVTNEMPGIQTNDKPGLSQDTPDVAGDVPAEVANQNHGNNNSSQV